MSGLPQAGPSIHAAPRAITVPGRPDTYAPEPSSWCPVRAGGAVRTWAQWVYLNSETRGDAIGSFCRRARADGTFPEDPTAVLRYLVTALAPADVLEVARQAVDEFRKWHAEGLELALAEVERTNHKRAASVRASLAASLEALDHLYAEDRALLDPEEACP